MMILKKIEKIQEVNESISLYIIISNERLVVPDNAPLVKSRQQEIDERDGPWGSRALLFLSGSEVPAEKREDRRYASSKLVAPCLESLAKGKPSIKGEAVG